MALSGTTAYALGAMLFIAAIGSYATHTMNKELKIHYPNLYNDLGRPALFAWRSIRDQWRFFRFLIHREYISLAHKKIKRLGDVVLLCNCINVTIAVCLLCFRYNEFHGWIE